MNKYIFCRCFSFQFPKASNVQYYTSVCYQFLSRMHILILNWAAILILSWIATVFFMIVATTSFNYSATNSGDVYFFIEASIKWSCILWAPLKFLSKSIHFFGNLLRRAAHWLTVMEGNGHWIRVQAHFDLVEDPTKRMNKSLSLYLDHLDYVSITVFLSNCLAHSEAIWMVSLKVKESSSQM